jgi:hypothetical protein
MIRPRYLPPDAYIDDPSQKLDPADAAEMAEDEMFSMAGHLLIRLHEWITRGRNQAKDRAFRTDIALLYLSPHLLSCKHPTASWVAQQHGVTRQRASDVGIAFSQEFSDYLQFRGQRFLNRRTKLYKRTGRIPRSCIRDLTYLRTQNTIRFEEVT